MSKLKKINKMSNFHFSNYFTNPRYTLVFILLTMYLNSVITPIRNFSKAVSVNSSIWLFPFLFGDGRSVLVIMIGFIFLICDAPFIDNIQPYILIRASRREWISAQLLYIAKTALLYFLIILLLTNILMIANITPSFKWGKVVGTLAQTNAGSQFNVSLNFSYKIISQFTPIQATGMCIFINVLVCCLLGLLLFYFNFSFSREIGTTITFIFVFLTYFCWEVGGYLFFYLSFVSWVNLDIIDFTFQTKMPSISYVLVSLLLVIMLLTLLISKNVKKKDIDILPPV